MPKGKGGMGFRDLHYFNKAMLAKLRARYYPDGKLLKARMRSGCSYTWQSILVGLDCFKQGYIWRVGGGSQVNIWEDNWILGSHNLKVLMPRGNNIITTVDELINPIDST
jgi:hypothetical protein